MMDGQEKRNVISGLELLRLVINTATRDRKREPTDYIDEEGLLVCGVCGQRREMMKEFIVPTEDGEELHILKVPCSCRCSEERRAREEQEKQVKKDMERIKRLRSVSLMEARFDGAVFRAFEVTPYNERNLRLCKRYVERFDQMLANNQGLLFWGDVGTGKSFAAACIANELLSRKVPVLMTSFVKLTDLIQHGKVDESRVLDLMGNAKLVIFDELGAERDTGYAIERVYNVIDTRYRQRLPSIVTTNLSLEDMKEEKDIRYKRIFDRIFESCYPAQFTGPSWRRKAANRRFEDMRRMLEDE